MTLTKLNTDVIPSFLGEGNPVFIVDIYRVSGSFPRYYTVQIGEVTHGSEELGCLRL